MWEKYKTERYETDGCYLPYHVMNSIVGYVESGLHPGSFLKAVITNDLGGAIAHGDKESLDNLVAIVKFIYNQCPSNCWGDDKTMSAWIKQKGLRR